MKRPVFVIVAVLLLGVVYIAGLSVGEERAFHAFPEAARAEEGVGAPMGVDFEPLFEAWQILEEGFVPAGDEGVPTPEERVWGAIQGLTKSYGDPNTVFLVPEAAVAFEEEIRGRFGGVGMELALREEGIVVVAPLKNTPAEKAGVRAGDVLLAVDGVSVEDRTLEEVVSQIRGEEGTDVTITFDREGVAAPFDIVITRAIIKVPTVEWEVRDDDIFVINFYSFNTGSASAFRTALREFTKSGSDDLLIDLRRNPGGLLSSAIDTTSHFLPAGKIVVREWFGEDIEEKVHRSKGYNTISEEDKDIVILVDGGSASASEIFAGALQEYDIATLIGTATFGKGSVQELIEVTPETLLKVTVAQWLTPRGRSISDGGLTPDVVIERTTEDIEAGRDPQLEKAIELLLE